VFGYNHLGLLADPFQQPPQLTYTRALLCIASLPIGAAVVFHNGFTWF